MTDEPRGWRALPPALLLGLGIELVFLIVRCGFDLSPKEGYIARMMFADVGIGVAASALVAAGLLDLARRLTASGSSR